MRSLLLSERRSLPREELALLAAVSGPFARWVLRRLVNDVVLPSEPVDGRSHEVLALREDPMTLTSAHRQFEE
jgi:hypothetical protein